MLAHLNPDLLKLLGAVLGPIIGFLATQGKTWFERRGKEKGGDRAITEINRYLRYSDTLDRLATFDPPPPHLAEARQTISRGIESSLANAMNVFAGLQNLNSRAIQVRKRTVLSRMFLLYKPSATWLWLLHGMFYLLIGIAALGSIGAYADDSDRVEGFLGMAVFVGFAIICNLIANYFDKKRSSGNQSSAVPVARMGVIFLLVVSIGLAGLWSSMLFFDHSMTPYRWLECVWVYTLLTVSFLWSFDQKHASDQNPGPLTRLTLPIFIGSSLALLATFGVTVYKVIHGAYPGYSAVLRGIALLFGIWALFAAISRRKHAAAHQITF
jgi:hypothetical protein